MGMKREYHEGPEVAEKFEEAMKILFRTRKPEIDRKETKTSSPKPEKNQKGQSRELGVLPEAAFITVIPILPSIQVT